MLQTKLKVCDVRRRINCGRMLLVPDARINIRLTALLFPGVYLKGKKNFKGDNYNVLFVELKEFVFEFVFVVNTLSLSRLLTELKQISN